MDEFSQGAALIGTQKALTTSRMASTRSGLRPAPRRVRTEWAKAARVNLRGERGDRPQSLDKGLDGHDLAGDDGHGRWDPGAGERVMSGVLGYALATTPVGLTRSLAAAARDLDRVFYGSRLFRLINPTRPVDGAG